MKKLWKRLKRFFKDIGRAFKDLFTKAISDEEEDGSVTVEVVNPKTRSEFGEWVHNLGAKIGKNIKNAIEYFVDNPVKALAWLTASGAGLGVVLTTCERIKRLFVDPAKDRIKQQEDKYRIYEPGIGYWKTNRPMSDSDKQFVRYHCQANKISMCEYLHNIGWLA